MSSIPQTDINDMQRLILQGLPLMRAARYNLMTIPEGMEKEARHDIGKLAHFVATASPDDKKTDKHEQYRICIAFTWKGLVRLGLDEDRLHNVPLAFREGMADATRARRLKDNPTNWDWSDALGVRDKEGEVHVLIALFSKVDPKTDEYGADVSSRLDDDWSTLVSETGLHGLKPLLILPDAFVGPDSKGHFGFRDGISQPYIEGAGTSRKPTGRSAAAHIIKPGEFVLGHANEFGESVPPLWVDRSHFAAAKDLPRNGLERNRSDFGRNGSYLVFRQLHQNVAAFDEFLDNAAARSGLDGELLAAKLVGRWRSGAPLALCPTKDDKRFKDSNDFLYENEDRYGYRCPIGSHVRRSYPRDSKIQPGAPLGEGGALRSARRRRIIRRGRPYYNADDESDRGLHFIGLNANIREQFEFVQETWINNRRFGVTRDEVDPIVGALRPRESRKFTVQTSPISQRFELRKFEEVDGETRVTDFVDVKGGGYFFLPSKSALAFLAQLGD